MRIRIKLRINTHVVPKQELEEGETEMDLHNQYEYSLQSVDAYFGHKHLRLLQYL